MHDALSVHVLHNALFLFCLTASLLSLVYLLIAMRCVWTFGRARGRAPGPRSPVTILKPVCGLDHQLYENLRSFCEQDYPEFQVVFGISSANDPAIEVVERLIEDLPQRDLALAVGSRVLGSNQKINNLANAYTLAKHPHLVIADSDMRVGPDYLRAVIADLEDRNVGAVTCLYKGSSVEGIASILGAAFINEWFLPSVLVALAYQKLRFCFGATMAIRRELFEQLGGFSALAPFLADDYMLGKLVSDRGYEVRLAPYLVQNIVLEADLKSLFAHELRWARTVRTVRPAGYALSFLTYALPTSLLFTLFFQSYYIGGPIVVLAIALRIMLHRIVRTRMGIDEPRRDWLVPIRDIFCFIVWAASFLGRDVQWRKQHFTVQTDGQIALKEKT